MATKKEHKIVSADSGKELSTREKKEVKERTTSAGAPIKEAKENGNPVALRIGAVVLWVVALACEVLAVLTLFGKISLTFMPLIWQLILYIVVDMILVIIGAQLWKKANHIDPMSEKKPFLFWLWNNMGVVAAIVCFVPLIILMLTNKNLDKKTKTICTIVAAVALLIAGSASFDYNPVSQEQKDAAVSVLGDTQVYWAPFGKVYHTHEDCQALNQSETLTVGTVDQAIANNRTRLCSFCAKRDAISGVATDGE